MISIKGMDHFQNLCREKLVEWYNKENVCGRPIIGFENTFVVWSCKTLQNYKCLVSTTISGDGIYAEYTYNGDRQEMYEDIYKKISNQCYINM